METEINKNVHPATKNLFDHPVMSWVAPEFILHEKGWQWFIAAGIVVLSFSIYSIITANWTLLIALIVISAVYYWQHAHQPDHVQIVVSEVGIKVGDKEYPFQNIDAFWVIYRPPHISTLNIRSNSRFLPDIAIQLGDQNPGHLREYLASQIPEIEGKEETFSEQLIRFLKL